MKASNTHALLFTICAVLLVGGAVYLLRGESRPRARSERNPASKTGRHRASTAEQNRGSADVRQGKPAGIARTEPRADPSLHRTPEVMYGPLIIQGVVVDEEGAGVPGAHVRCVPEWFEVPTAGADRRFVASADDEGQFRLDRLPAVRRYRLYAVAEDRFGELVVEQGSTGQRHTIQTTAWRYQLLTFVTGDEEPVPVGRIQHWGPEFRGGILTTAGTTRPWKIDVIAHGMGIEVDLASNQIATFYSDERGPPKGRRLDIPGYAEAELPNRTRPISDWPAAEVILMTPSYSPDMVVYEVQFPHLDWPAHWKHPPDISFRWVWTDRNHGLIVSRRNNALIGRRGRPFKLLAPYQNLKRDSLPYQLEELGGRIVVAPQLPKLGFVTLEYDAVRGERLASVLVNGQEGFAVANEWPGRTRIGPLPVGPYEALLSWSGGVGAGVRNADRIRFEIAPGHRILRVD